MAPWTLSFVFGLPRHHPHTRTEVNRAWARGSGEGQGEQDSHEPAGGVATSTGDLGISDLRREQMPVTGYQEVGLLEALIYLTIGNQVFAPRNWWSIKSLAFGFQSSGHHILIRTKKFHQPGAHAALAEVLAVPIEIRRNHIPDAMPVTEFLMCRLPEESCTIILSKPRTWFSSNMPNTDITSLMSLPIPPPDFLRRLREEAGQAWWCETGQPSSHEMQNHDIIFWCKRKNSAGGVVSRGKTTTKRPCVSTDAELDDPKASKKGKWHGNQQIEHSGEQEHQQFDNFPFGLFFVFLKD
ncbi:hypothetical protein B0H10DRAFT_1947190 [Mycena sp. CBHHK59/15]|nr:hypothetical protein B0H10DRAFT_1947190 [Mycena sp. CBHHK59/15]